MTSTINDNTTYVFMNWATNKVMDLFEAKKDAGTPIINYSAHLNNYGNQTWTVKKSAYPNNFTLTSVATGGLVDLKGETGPAIVEATADQGDSQQWSFESASADLSATPSFFIKNKSNGQYVTVPDQSSYNGKELQAVAKDGDYSRWIAIPFKI